MTVQTEISLAPETQLSFKRPNPFLAVAAWELRLMAARQATWLFLLAVLAASAFLTWNNRQMDMLRFDDIYPIFAHPTSGQGAIMFEVSVLVLLLGMIIPLAASGSVARDFRRRTHELLMTTSMPGWAYIWGRYLAGLLLGLAVAGVMLAGTVMMGLLLATDLPLDQYRDISFAALHHYPQPNLGALLQVWLAFVVPSLLVTYSLSFGLVALLPRRAGLLKALFVFCWILSTFYWVILGDHTDFDAWHPNYLPMTWQLQELYQADYNQTFFQTPGNSPEIRLQVAGQVEQKLFDIWSWQFPHLLYIVLSLALVVYLAERYRRKRGN